MKKIVKIAFIAVVAAVAGYGVYTSQGEEIGMSDVALANVEVFVNAGALTGSESGLSDCETYCTTDSRCKCIIIYYGETQGITCENARGK